VLSHLAGLLLCTLTFGGILRLRAPTLGGAGVVFAIEAYLKISF